VSAGLLDQLQRHATDRPDSPAYRQGSNTLTYRQLAGSVQSFATHLRKQCDPGSVVLLSCSNRLEYPVAFLATLAAGCNLFPVSTELTETELLRAAKESSAAVSIGDESLRNIVRLAIPLSEISKTETGTLTPSPIGNLFLQSSGTTAVPKIVCRSGPSIDRAAEVIAAAIGLTPHDSVMMTIPLTHSYGLEHGLLAPVWAGCCTTLVNGLDLSVVLPALQDGKITIFPGVPSTFEMLAGVADTHFEMKNLRSAYSAGAPLPLAVFEKFYDRFSIKIAQLYGASEIGSVAFNRISDDFEPSSVGAPMRGVSVRILNPDDSNQSLPTGEQGMVAIRASSMFSGYLRGNAEMIDGHFLTGDLGRVDDAGRLYITGRLKSLIDVGGLKVNPLEVEAVLQKHPAVGSCVVIPVAQSETVFRLKAVVTPRDPSVAIPIDELRTLAREHLSSHKVPRWFEVRDSIPTSATGKILRHLVEKE
jgi:long-chain acyl-CoA synthetase